MAPSGLSLYKLHFPRPQDSQGTARLGPSLTHSSSTNAARNLRERKVQTVGKPCGACAGIADHGQFSRRFRPRRGKDQTNTSRISVRVITMSDPAPNPEHAHRMPGR